MSTQLASFTPSYNLPILGPYGVAVTGLTTAAIDEDAEPNAIAADQARAGIIFSNPGTANKRVMPAGSNLVGGSGGILIYPQSEFILLKNADMAFNVNCGWNAVTDDNADGVLTILDFTPNTPGAPRVYPTTRLWQQNPVESPIVEYDGTVATGSVAVVEANPNRMGIEFHNPGTVVLGLCPSNLGASIGAGSIILLPGQTKSILGNTLVKVNCAWNAAAESGSANPLIALGLYG